MKRKDAYSLSRAMFDDFIGPSRKINVGLYNQHGEFIIGSDRIYWFDLTNYDEPLDTQLIPYTYASGTKTVYRPRNMEQFVETTVIPDLDAVATKIKFSDIDFSKTYDVNFNFKPERFIGQQTAVWFPYFKTVSVTWPEKTQVPGTDIYLELKPFREYFEYQYYYKSSYGSAAIWIPVSLSEVKITKLDDPNEPALIKMSGFIRGEGNATYYSYKSGKEYFTIFVYKKEGDDFIPYCPEGTIKFSIIGRIEISNVVEPTEDDE